MKLLWLPEHDSPLDALTCLALHAARWVSAPAPTAGERFIAVVPAGVYQWHDIELPKLPRSQLTAAAASVLEPHLLQEVEQCVFHVEPRDARGRHKVAVIDRAWLARTRAALEAAGLAALRWVPETSLMQVEPSRWMLLYREGEWLLASGAHQHCVLDHSEDHVPPLMLRAALDAHGSPTEICVAGVPAPPQLAERHSPPAPLWLATLGLRARVIEGTGWIASPDGTSPDFSPEGGRSRWRADWSAWRTPALLALAILITHGAGLLIQYAQWQNEATTQEARLEELRTQLSREQAVLAEPASHRLLAALLDKLAALQLTPPAITRVEFDGKQLIAELDASRIDASFGARVEAQGGTLVGAGTNTLKLRFAAGGAR